jgi:hypothetical protein
VIDEGFQISLVTTRVLRELRIPEFNSRFWCVGKPATSMAMPKTAVYEDDGLPARKDDIGPSGQAATMEPKPKSLPVQHGPNSELGSGVATLDPPHVPTSLFTADPICHLSRSKRPRQPLRFPTPIVEARHSRPDGIGSSWGRRKSSYPGMSECAPPPAL